MTDALKLCPFCGSDHVRINGGSNSSYVECLECGVEGPFSDFTEAQAASAWNRRHVAVTDEMVERAAKALASDDGWPSWPELEDVCDGGGGFDADYYRRQARAALTAALSGDADD